MYIYIKSNYSIHAYTHTGPHGSAVLYRLFKFDKVVTPTKEQPFMMKIKDLPERRTPWSYKFLQSKCYEE